MKNRKIVKDTLIKAIKGMDDEMLYDVYADIKDHSCEDIRTIEYLQEAFEGIEIPEACEHCKYRIGVTCDYKCEAATKTVMNMKATIKEDKE